MPLDHTSSQRASSAVRMRQRPSQSCIVVNKVTFDRRAASHHSGLKGSLNKYKHKNGWPDYSRVYNTVWRLRLSKSNHYTRTLIIW